MNDDEQPARTANDLMGALARIYEDLRNNRITPKEADARMNQLPKVSSFRRQGKAT